MLLLLPNWLVILVYAIHGVAIACIVASWAFVHIYRKRPIVAIGQTQMLSVLCFGALVVCIGNIIAVTAIVIAPRNEDISGKWLCSFSYWLPFLGLISVFAIQLLKLYRVFKVVQFRRGLKVLPHHVYGPFAAIVLFGVGILIAWEILFPLEFHVVDFPVSDASLRSCVRPTDYGILIFGSILSGIIIVLNLAVLVMACKVKNVDKELGDSKRIWTSQLIVFIASIPLNSLYHSMNHDTMFGIGPTARFSCVVASDTLNFLVPAIAPVGCLIFPRMYYLWYEHRHGHLPDGVQEYGRGNTQVTINRTAERTPPTVNALTLIDEVDNDGVDEEASA